MSRHSHISNTGFTLIELLITIGLMGVIILAITAIDVGARRFLNTANYEAQVQSEAGPVLERMVKEITLAYGEMATPSPGISIPLSGQRIEVRRLDSNIPPTYSNYADDPLVSYTYDSGSFNINRATSPCSGGFGCPSWSAPEVVARNIENCLFFPGSDGTVGITIAARRTAKAVPPPVSFENPRITLETSVSPRSNSLN